MRELLATGEARATAFLIAVATAASAALIHHLGVPVVDDAGISIAYGWTFWTGHGLRLTPESVIAEGYSNPLWTLVSGLTPLLSDDPVRATGTLGIALAVASLPIWALWGPLGSGRALRVEDAVVAMPAATSTSFAYWAAAGLEGGLLTFLLALGGALLLRDLRRGKGSLAGLVLGLACLTRPEGVVYAGIAGLLVLGVRARERRRPGRQELLALAWGVAIVGGFLAVRVAYFASWVPNTYYAKFGLGESGWPYVEEFARAFPTTVGAAITGFVLVAIARGRALPSALLAGGFIAATVFFAVRAGGDWMREWRFLAPAVPATGVLFAAALSTLRDRFALAPGRSRRARDGLGMAFVIATSALVTHEAWDDGRVRIEENREAPTLSIHWVADTARHIEALGARLGLVRPRVGIPDVGGNGLALRRAEIVDVGALCDVAIARSFHANPAATEDYLTSEGLPTLLDVHGPSGALYGMRALMRSYAPIHGVERDSPLIPEMWIVRGLTADEDPRCPGGLDAVRAMSTDALSDAIDRSAEAREPLVAIQLYRCAREHRETLPSARWHDSATEAAGRASERAEASGDLTLALRYASLATILSGQNAWRRQRTERLRARVYPPPDGFVRRWL